MGERKCTFVPGEFYHIYNRGNGKQDIFLSDIDYQRFQILLYLCNSTQSFKVDHLRKQKKDFFEVDRSEHLIAVGAYCLMPNHFHLLVTPVQEEGISAFMKKLGTGYAMYFNAMHERTGGLFEGKFKAKLASEDEYLKYLYSYVHLNPLSMVNSQWREVGVTNKDKEYLKAYPYSSYYDFVRPNSRREHKILNSDPFPSYFEQEPSWSHVEEWLSDRKDLSL